MPARYPEQVGPVSDYILRWVNAPRTPPGNPPGLSILQHTYATVAHPTLSFRDAMQVAARRNAWGTKVVQLRRGQKRKSPDGNREELTLLNCNALRRSQGIAEVTAVAEWWGSRRALPALPDHGQHTGAAP